MHAFATAGHKDPSFKYGPWARYTSLITALTMFGVGLGGVFLSDPESFAGFGMYAMIISVPLAVIEWPISRVTALLPFLADYRWRALTYFMYASFIACSLACPCLLAALLDGRCLCSSRSPSHAHAHSLTRSPSLSRSLSLSIPMAVAFPVQLGAFFLLTDAILYGIGHLRGESGAPDAPKGNRV